MDTVAASPMRDHVVRPSPAGRTTGFTLIELLVVLVIIALLSSLTLAGLAGVRQRAKIDKTKSTIRKIDAVIRPMYDSYRTRRVALPAVNSSKARLWARRRLMVREMPDCWADVVEDVASLEPWLQTAPVRAYAAVKQSLPKRSDPYGSAECLYLIVTRSGFEPDALEAFRDTEIGDIDNDGAPEFWDGWGRPIAFMRWAPGFSPYSAVQVADPNAAHDPMDPWRDDANAFALIPLIYSPGPDEALNDPLAESASGYGLLAVDKATGWSAMDLGLIFVPLSIAASIGAPDPANPKAFRDNITNHDLLKK